MKLPPKVIPAKVAERLAKFVALLASDNDSEVLAAVAAIKRALIKAGLDLNDLSASIGKAKAPTLDQIADQWGFYTYEQGSYEDILRRDREEQVRRGREAKAKYEREHPEFRFKASDRDWQAIAWCVENINLFLLTQQNFILWLKARFARDKEATMLTRFESTKLFELWVLRRGPLHDDPNQYTYKNWEDPPWTDPMAEKPKWKP